MTPGIGILNNAVATSYLRHRIEDLITPQSSFKVHLNAISNGELSDPLFDSVNRDLTLVRLLPY